MNRDNRKHPPVIACPAHERRQPHATAKVPNSRNEVGNLHLMQANRQTGCSKSGLISVRSERSGRDFHLASPSGSAVL